jgi:hypothetical protein
MVTRAWIAISLFAIVAQLAVIRGFDIRQVMLFGVPVVFALMVASHEPATRGTLLAQLFLSLIGLGLVVAKVSWIFPQLGGMDAGLPRESDRALTWYCTVYLLFFSAVLPAHAFTDALHHHRLGRPAKFSELTCYLGLMTAILMAPGMLWIAIKFFHIWPFF